MAPRIRLKRGTLAALVAADLTEGEICYATDQKIVLVSDGIGKYHVSSPAFDLRENRPAPGLRGSIFVATDTKESWIDDGVIWQPIVEFGVASGSVCEGDDARLSDARTPTSHTHGGADITDLVDYISGLDFPYADQAHTHAEADITDLGPYADQAHTHAEADITDLGPYADQTHTHAEADITDLGPYADQTHTHAEADITDLGPYADQTHTHAEADITDLGPYASLESDMVPTDELGTGTADSGSFLRGDRTWQPVSVGYPSTWYWADQSFMAKPVSVAADRYKFLTPNVVQSDVGGASLSLSSQATLDLSLEATWDTVSGTDYRTASNRAGKDFYIYLCQPGSGTAPVVKVSANSTTPSGYTAANSRKVGGFPCLCVAAGTLSGHPANGYVAGDIIPNGVWDLKFRAANGNNAGMAYVAPLDTWIDIYLASGTGASTASANGGTISDTRTWLDFVDDGAAVKKRMLRDYEFQIAAAGSNEETNIAGSADPGTTGGHSDTASRRMISNYFLEDCCGALWQWLDEQSTRWDFTTAWGWYDLPGSKGSLYNGAGAAGTGDVKLIAGGFWGDGANCGSRSRNADNCRWPANALIGCRFAARSITK